MTDFRDLIGDDLTPEEEARLRRVHDLLVATGPPPELPPMLRELPTGKRQRVPGLPRRRLGAALILATAGAAAAFGIGFLVGGRGNGFVTERVVAMHRTAAAPVGAIASIDVGEQDKAGNWPLRLHVTRLPQPSADGYYELWLTRKGKPVATCGTFRIHGDRTTVRLNAPYKLKAFDGWVVTDDHRRQVFLTTARLA